MCFVEAVEGGFIEGGIWRRGGTSQTHQRQSEASQLVNETKNRA
jgi:hypothetical protein